jgi:hypothetical protein
MNYTNIYNAIDTQDDFINCDRFLDIEADLSITLEELDLFNNQLQ